MFNFNPQEFGKFMNNPMQFMARRNLNIPQNLSNDPKAIVQHLLNTGQMSQSTYNQLNSFKRQMDERAKTNNSAV